ncbi:unnamed protein product [Alopecurus aequalis]
MSGGGRRHARSPAAGPLDDDDLLCEILLRLPPQPSSLPRASAVCKRWHRLVSDLGFFRRFRLHHRRSPPLLGFFDRFDGLSFLPALDAPNRISPGRFSLQQNDDYDRSLSLGCRHGLVLIFLPKRLQVLVWDPVTGDQHHIAIPPGVATYAEKTAINGAVLCPAGDGQHFHVVLAVVGSDDKQHEQALACVYSSKTSQWGNLISTRIPYQDNVRGIPNTVHTNEAVLAGDSLYWELTGKVRILEFHLVKQNLAMIRVPVDSQGKCFRMMRAGGGGLGLILVSQSDCTAQLWKRKNDHDGVMSWVLGRTIELHKLLSLKTWEKWPLVILGFAEENNEVFLWTTIGMFIIHLESLKFKKLSETNFFSCYHPFESVYVAGTCVGVGHDGAELLLST